MIPVPIILAFLKNNWKIIAIGLAVASLVGYITFLRWEVKHYRVKYENAQAELAAAKTREDELSAANAGITRKYEESLKDVNAVVDKMMEYVSENIKKDEELASIKLSLNAARLFNQSKRDPSTKSTTTKQGDARETNTPQTSAYSGNVKIPLTDFFIVVAENDANHWKCVKQVELWQSFWGDYANAVQRAYQ